MQFEVNQFFFRPSVDPAKVPILKGEAETEPENNDESHSNTPNNTAEDNPNFEN